ncbi:unnamed protein product [Chrysodeixis includens]|uniref:Farnesyl pyrophosphate synthase n=1 Tax=Chrysodeixis includens TaxID=689277 RepID=A0A9P0BVH3_CHRIL|nr:unnamed protein product [Chrysodeixis includens]
MNICRKVASNVVGKGFSIASNEFCNRSAQRFCSAVPNNIDLKKEREEFLNALPGVLDVLAKHPVYKELPDTEKWMREVIHGTVTGGKNSRGINTVISYRVFEKPEKITEESLRQARTLGWCAEILQGYLVVLDDIMDGSLTRRGQPCWYLRDGVGVGNAINDAILIHYCIQQLIRANFENSPNYLTYIHNFSETVLYTSIGQHLDIMTGLQKKNYNLFTKEHYDSIVINKSSYYTYKLPLTLGMILANSYNDVTNKNAENISFLLGRLFQIQDDYMDCFGDDSLTGKLGSDIQEGKCTWLAVNALNRCKENHKSVFKVCYGSREPAHVERIKQLYIDLKIPELYKQEENDIYNLIVQKIKSLPTAPERELYQMVLREIYGRNR